MSGLTFVLGEIGSGKSHLIYDRIRELAEKKERVYLIVPEQYSSTAEHRLYEHLGIRLFNRVHTDTFSRLKKAIAAAGNVRLDAVPDRGAMSAVMYTVRRDMAAGGLNCFGNIIRNPAFTASCIKMSRELEMNGIDPESFSPKGIDDSALAAKIKDIASICGEYNSRLSECGYRSAVTEGRLICEAAAETGFFKDCHIFIDQFKSFTADQTELIKIMKNSGNVTVCMPTPYSAPNDSPIFSTVNENMEKLSSDCSPEIIFTSGRDRYENAPDIRTLSRTVLRNEGASIIENAEHIHIAEADNTVSEAEYVAASISRLVREKKYRYSDIAVLSRDLDSVRAPIEDAFEIYSIPYFMDSPSPASSKPLMIFIMTLLEAAAAKTPSSEMILRLMKTFFTPVEEEHISQLEQFYTERGIIKESWEGSPIAADCSGITYDELLKYDSLSSAEKAESELDHILNVRENAAVRAAVIRNAVMLPIGKFRKSCEGEHTLGFICEKLCLLLDELMLLRRAEKLSEGDSREARDFRRLWNALDSAVRSVSRVTLAERYDSFGIKDFRELFGIIISQIKISSPAHTLNCVTVSSSDRARPDRPKVVFIMSAVSGYFPYIVSENGIFTEREMEVMEEKLGIRFASRIPRMAAEESFIAVSALAAPSHELYITYPLASLSGKAYSRSPLADSIISAAGIRPARTSEAAAYEYITTPRSAYSAYVRRLGRPDAIAPSERAAVMNIYSDSIGEKLDAADRLHSRLRSKELFRRRIEPAHALRLYGGEKREFSVSASRIEDFAGCPFMFFCKKGLGLYPSKKLDYAANVQGNISHYVLKELLVLVSAEAEKNGVGFNEQLASYSRQALTDIVMRLTDEYLKSEFTDKNYLTSPTFEKTARKYADVIIETALRLQKEFAPENSRFSPAAFEYSIGSTDKGGSGGMPAFRIMGKNTAGQEFTISFTGSVDRIDVFTDSSSGKDVHYLRVVDYKTGKKEFDLNEIADGINMQMLLYLFIVTDRENGSELFSEHMPAGVLYMPSHAISTGKVKKLRSYDDPEGTLEELTDSSFRMSGMTLSDVNVIRAMEYDAQGRFIRPVLNTESCLEELDARAYVIYEAVPAIQQYCSAAGIDRTSAVLEAAYLLTGRLSPTELAEMNHQRQGAAAEAEELISAGKCSEDITEKLNELILSEEIYTGFDSFFPADTHNRLRRRLTERLTEPLISNSKSKDEEEPLPSRANALTEEEMKNVGSGIMEKLTDICTDICSGNADISPLYSKTPPCTYCDYKSICENISSVPAAYKRPCADPEAVTEALRSKGTFKADNTENTIPHTEKE